MSIVSPMDSMVPHYPQTGGPPDKGLISDATGTMFAETPAPGKSIQDQLNALSENIQNQLNALGGSISNIATILEDNTYRIVYDANGGEGAPVDNNLYFTGGAAFVIDDPAPTREGYEFLGYALTSDAAEPVEITQIPIIESLLSEIAPDHVITLYAVWEEVESDGEGGSDSGSDK